MKPRSGSGLLVFFAEFDEEFFPVGIRGNAVHLEHFNVVEVRFFETFTDGLQAGNDGVVLLQSEGTSELPRRVSFQHDSIKLVLGRGQVTSDPLEAA